MFKKFVLPAVALVAITSCSSDEVLNTNSNPDGQDYISFNTVVGNNSRGAETTIESLKDKNGFYVVAYGGNSLYFNRSAAKYSAAVTEGDDKHAEGWFLADNYYWPSYELTFAAWYPTTLTPATNGSWTEVTGSGLTSGDYVSRPTFGSDGGVTARHKIQGYSLPVNIDNQVDIVVAREKATKPTGTENTAVAMQFRHIFSQIEVKANYSGEGAIKVEVAGVALRYIPNKGTFTFPDNETSTTDLATTDWAIDRTAFTNLTEGTTLSDADAANFTLNRFVNQITSTELTSSPVSLNAGNKNFLIIPQNFGSFVWSETAKKDGAYLAVKVKISARQADGNSYKQIYPTDTNKEYGWAAVGVFSNEVLKALTPGTHYNINLTFTDNSAGKGDPDPVDPTPDPKPDKPGEDILGEPIWFSVDVAKWVENSQDINKPTNTPGA